MRTSPWRKQFGGETVEFAFTLPFLLLLLGGFVEFGIFLADGAVFADASRAAAREAISCGDTVAACDQRAQDAADDVLASGIRMWSSGTPYVCGGGGCDIDREGASDPGDTVTVTVTLPYQFRLLPRFGTVQVSGWTQMRMLPH